MGNIVKLRGQGCIAGGQTSGPSPTISRAYVLTTLPYWLLRSIRNVGCSSSWIPLTPLISSATMAVIVLGHPRTLCIIALMSENVEAKREPSLSPWSQGHSFWMMMTAQAIILYPSLCQRSPTHPSLEHVVRTCFQLGKDSWKQRDFPFLT